MRVLSATGIEELDRELADVLPQHGITVAGDCYSRLVLTKVAMELEADTVIISPLLKNGENDLVQVIVNLRDKGIRVIVLPGHPEMVKTQELIKKLVPYGVYDYCYDKVGIKNIIERLMNPAALGDIPKHLIDAATMQRAGDEISEEIKKKLPDNVQETSGIKKRVFGFVNAWKGQEPEPPKDSELIKAKSKSTPFSTTPLVSASSVPNDFWAVGNIPGVQCCFDVKDVMTESPAAVLVPVSPEVCMVIKDLRREPLLSHVPVVVVGQGNDGDCYKAGADECILCMDDEAVVRIRARSCRMRELWEKAGRDDLTGLHKRNFLTEYLAEQERRSRETGAPFSVMMVDLDHFKLINDTHGHQAGDDVLKQFAAFLQEGVRRVDVVARYGGEEFVVVFPGAGIKEVLPVAGRLRQEWEKQKIELPSGEKIRSSFSAGLAAMGKDADNWEALIEAADVALYRAKRTGRNKVLAAGAPELRKYGEPESLDLSSHFIILTGYAPREVVDLSGRIKGKLVIIDADVENGSIAGAFGIDPEAVWKSDWRAGPTAEPFKINRKLRFYGLDQDVKNFEKRDMDLLAYLIMRLRKYGQKILINTGGNEEILRLVKSLKEEEANNGLCLRV